MTTRPEGGAIVDGAGGRIGRCDYGDPNGRIVIAAHGTPGADMDAKYRETRAPVTVAHR
ncbi:hypothetical protein [Nocardia panacis]|uniref:hypothetical protein n=1 Tax=Nocardia panacis TaxID=2340916 RepID=UPI0013150926|nr:hypothetical protein [Nocardia panacis]